MTEKQHYDYLIGVDTGVNTGLAVWNVEGQWFDVVESITIIQAIFLIADMHTQTRHNEPMGIIFEDARKRKWIPQEKNIKQLKGRAMGAGSVKRDAQIWEELCKELKIPYKAQAPQRGMTKHSANQFTQLTGWKGKTNEHSRDAAMLVFGKKTL